MGVRGKIGEYPAFGLAIATRLVKLFQALDA